MGVEFRDESLEKNMISGMYLRNRNSTVLCEYSQSLGYISCVFIIAFNETSVLPTGCECWAITTSLLL